MATVRIKFRYSSLLDEGVVPCQIRVIIGNSLRFVCVQNIFRCRNRAIALTITVDEETIRSTNSQPVAHQAFASDENADGLCILRAEEANAEEESDKRREKSGDRLGHVRFRGWLIARS